MLVRCSISCLAAPRLPPIILHQPSSIESHYHSVSQPFFLQSHRVGPFLSSLRDADHVPSLSIYSSGECGISKLTVKIAWKESLGRLGVRYWMGLAMWSVAVVGILLAMAWHTYDSEGMHACHDINIAQAKLLRYISVNNVGDDAVCEQVDVRIWRISGVLDYATSAEGGASR